MAKGGLTKPFSAETSSAITGGGMVASSLLDTIDPTDRFGTRSGVGAAGSGAIKGAMAGAALGPAGLVGGAIVGAATSFIGNKKAQEEKQNILTEEVEDATKERDAQVLNRLANNPELQYGSGNSSMYNYGGTVKGKPSGRFNLMRRTPKSVSLSPDLLPDIAISPNKIARFKDGGKLGKVTMKADNTRVDLPIRKELRNMGGRLPIIKKAYNNKLSTKDTDFNNWYKKNTLEGQSNIPYNEKLSYDYYSFYKNGEYKDPSFNIEQHFPDTYKRPNHPTFSNESIYSTPEYPGGQWEGEKYNKNGKFIRYQNGGRLKPLAPGISKVQGPSHEEGGVKFPELNAELEGGETISGDFVFSKDLGFAKVHERLAKSMNKNSKRPLTVLNKQTAEAMSRKEGFLKIYQEQVKKEKGLSNEIDNTAKAMKEEQKTGPAFLKYGGKLPKKDNGGFLRTQKKITLPESGEKQPRIKDLIDAAAPFASNVANAFRKLPAPPKPIMDDTITPSFINLDASRAEATRARRGADKAAAESLNGNNQVAAVKAANLTQAIRATNEINQAEQTTNTGIKNQAIQTNAAINRANNLKKDYFNSQKVERQVKQQELNAENLSDVGNKIQLINRDKAQFELEDTKNLLTILGDPTGATIRASGSALKRIIKDPKVYQDILKRGKELETMNDEDRKSSLEFMKSQLNLISPKSVLNNTTALPADTKTEAGALKNEYLKARTAIQQIKKAK